MIHVVTVHWMTDKWIPVQLRQLEKCAGAPYRIYASLNGIDDPDTRSRFHYSADVPGEHPEKLNVLAAWVLDDAEPSDILVFIDGDAFPIQPLQPWLGETLDRHPLVAIQRTENCDDLRPHPSFCATTAGFWKSLACDWTPSEWVGPSGTKFGDAGGHLAEILEANAVDWLPLNRTNTHDLHPLWFAVYGHRIYHHGAGFRDRSSRVDIATRQAALKVGWADPSLGNLVSKLRYKPSLVFELRPRHARRLIQGARRTLYNQSGPRYEAKANAEADRIFSQVNSDASFYRQFDSTVP